MPATEPDLPLAPRGRPAPRLGLPAIVAPITVLAVTSTLACVDAHILEDVHSDPSPVRTTPASPPAADATGGGAATADAPAPPERPAMPSCVRVRLERVGWGRAAKVSVEGGWRLHAGALVDLDRPPGALLAVGEALHDAAVSAEPAAVRINGEVVAHPAVTLVPDHSGRIRVDGRAYRGVLLLESREGGLDVINLVDLDDYVAGVLHAEMPSRFAAEARRAQAVAARTYALYHAARGRDLRDDQGSQVYLGTERESEDARRIVASTAAEVLTSDGVPFETYFHSTCGGATSGARDVFGPAAPPPLRGGVVCDGCRDAPRYRWTTTLDRDRVRALYRGSLDAFQTLRVEEEDAAGRARVVALVDAAGQVLDRPLADRFRNDYNQGLPLSRQLLSSFFTRITSGSGGVEVAGRGFGHGVGLCQYGADGLAAQGLDYRQILSRYYPDSQIKRLDG